MTDITSTDWTPQDEGNISASPNGSQGGFAPNTIPPTIRAIRGAVKRAHNKINAILTTTGTATALILTHTVAPAALVKGERYAFFASQTNSGAMTLAINGLGAKSILQQDGTALKAGQVVSGSAVCVIYDGVAFRLEQYISNPKFSGTLTADAFTTTGASSSGSLSTGALSAGATTVLSLTSTGAITASSITSTGVAISGSANTDRVMGWQTSGVQRWSAYSTGDSENGTANGSNFAIARYANNGNFIDNPIYIVRGDGNTVINKLTTNNNLYVGSSGTFLGSDGNILFTGGMASQGSNLGEAFNRKANLASPTFTGTLNLPSVSETSFKQGTGDGASFTTYNTVMKGWWGMGMATYDNTVNGYYDFRGGSWNVKGGMYRNGVEYIQPNGANHNISVLGSAASVYDAGNVNAQRMVFNWNGQPGNPAWIWGGVDGKNMYVYQPGNLSVGNSAQLGGIAASEYDRKPVRNAPETPSGTAYLFNGIPANAQKVNLKLAGLTNNAGVVVIRAGNSSAILNAGYKSTCDVGNGSGTGYYTDGIYLWSGTDGNPYYGSIEFKRLAPGSNRWIVSGIVGRGINYMATLVSDITVDLTRIQITTNGGTGTLGGSNSLAIEWEF